MKCQVVINSREKLANIIDSFHYAKSTYNWPGGSLLPLRTNVESSAFSAVENIRVLLWVSSDGRLQQALPLLPNVSPSANLHASLQIQNEVEGLMMKIARSVYSYALTSKGPFCFFCIFFFSIIWLATNPPHHPPQNKKNHKDRA